jgi:hypothetical protein
VPIGEQNLFVESADVELDPFVHGGVAAAIVVCDDLATIVQVEANTTAFRDVPFLSGPPVTLFAGLRKLFGNFVLEGGAGVGLIQASSYDYAFSLALGYLF